MDILGESRVYSSRDSHFHIQTICFALNIEVSFWAENFSRIIEFCRYRCRYGGVTEINDNRNDGDLSH